jgi:transcriptional regulator with GAF, ATPase, and Fis domain
MASPQEQADMSPKPGKTPRGADTARPSRFSAEQAYDVLRSTLGLLHLVDQSPLDRIIQQGLDDAVRLTDSRIGYLHFVNADQATIRLYTWSTGTMKVCTAVEAPHYPIAQAGIWVDCVHRREPVIHNDYAAEPHRKGLPAGHVALTRDLGVPVFENGQVVAVLGVGNKEALYDHYDVELTQLLANTIWSIVHRKRVHEHLSEQIAARTEELEQRNRELQQALADVQTLSGIVPICSYCKKIRDDRGYWNQLESYLSVRTEARFSHGICPACARKEFPDL